MRKPETPLDDERPQPGESFLQRFHRRKLEARSQGIAPQAPTDGDAKPGDVEQDLAEQEAPAELTDADMPPLESLSDESDYRGFLSSKVSESLRRAALRKLFHSSSFNVIDELDDYAEDFTTFEALGDLVTAEMRHRLEIEERRLAEREQQQAEEQPPNGHETVDGPLEAEPEGPSDAMPCEPETLDTVTAEAGAEPPPSETDSHAERSADT